MSGRPSNLAIHSNTSPVKKTSSPHSSAPARLRETVSSARTGAPLFMSVSAQAAVSTSSVNLDSGEFLEDMPPTPPEPGLSNDSAPNSSRSTRRETPASAAPAAASPLGSPSFSSPAGSPNVAASPSSNNFANNDDATARPLQTKNESNLVAVMEFVSKLTQGAAAQPRMSLPALLETFNLVEDKGEAPSDSDVDDDSDRKSSISTTYSFNFGSSSESASSIFGNALHGKKDGSALRPFSSELAHRCWIENQPSMLTREQQEARAQGWRPKKSEAAAMAKVMVPWRGEAAILFVDVSGYSKVTTLLAEKGGAHALASAVNSYFETLMSIVKSYSGDLCTYAGDAAVIAFPCSSVRKPIEVCIQACACALEMQRRAGTSAVEGIEEKLGIHIAITFGAIESQILKASNDSSNQGAFHFMSGVPLVQTAQLVDLAKRGEVCISSDVLQIVGSMLRVDAVPDVDPVKVPEGAFTLRDVDDEYRDVLDSMPVDMTIRRSPWLESAMIATPVANKLKQGFKAHHIAEMRHVAVLFVRKMLPHVRSDAWFAEIEQILTAGRCDIIQILDDDKGVHIIAAVGLFHTEAHPATVAIEAARKMWERDTGCVIGCAVGETFCGITGSEAASRWDITGPAVVRAARLMQHGVENGIVCVFDSSIAQHTDDDSQLQQSSIIKIKGSTAPIRTYTLTEKTVSVTRGIMSLLWVSESLHHSHRETIKAHVSTPFQRSFLYVSGAVGSGKKTAISLALRDVGINNIVHFSTRDKTPLTLLRTIGDWFSHHLDGTLASGGLKLRGHLDSNKITQALNTAHELIAAFIARGLQLVVVVAYIHLLDKDSLEFIKSIITTAPTDNSSSSSSNSNTSGGKFLFIGTSYSLWGYKSPKEIEQEFTLSLRENERTQRLYSDRAHLIQTELTRIHISYTASADEFADAVRGVTYWILRKHTANVLLEAMGGCLMLIQPAADLLRARYLSQISESLSPTEILKQFYMPATLDGTLHLTSAGSDFFFREIDWRKVAPAATARFLELYDELPPRLQLVLRVVACLGTVTGAANKFHCSNIITKLNRRITVERVYSDLDLLVDSEILKGNPDDEDEYMFRVPAMVDCVVNLLTPDQTRLMKRYAFKLVYENAYKPHRDGRLLPVEKREKPLFIPDRWWPVFCTFIAKTARAADENALYMEALQDAWRVAVSENGGVAENGKNQAVFDKVVDRLYWEARQNPTVCNAALFDSMQDVPLKPPLMRHVTEAEKEFLAQKFMPAELVWLTQYKPPMALGAFSGEYQKICWHIGNSLLDMTKQPGMVFITPELRSVISKINFDKLMSATAHLLELFQSASDDVCARPLESQMRSAPRPGECPVFDSYEPPETLEAERAFLEGLVAPMADVADGLRKLRQFRAYHYKVVMSRRDIAVALQHDVRSVGMIRCAKMQGALSNSCMGKAYARLAREHPIPTATIHHAIMDLATAGWLQSRHYFHCNLQLIRDQVLRRHEATVEDLKSFLAINVEFGEVLS